MAKIIAIIVALIFVSGLIRIVGSYVILGRFAKRHKATKVPSAKA